MDTLFLTLLLITATCIVLGACGLFVDIVVPKALGFLRKYDMHTSMLIVLCLLCSSVVTFIAISAAFFAYGWLGGVLIVTAAIGSFYADFKLKERCDARAR